MLTVHRAASGDVLVRALADVLAEPPDDPFAADIVAVPAKGVERWIAQRLAHVLGADDGDGVCANVTFPWPSTLLDEVLQSACAEHADTFAKWAPGRLTWPLLDVLEASTGEAWCAALTAHLGPADDDRGRRVSVAGRLASSFDQYGQARPAMLRAWAQGRDEAGDGTPLDDDLRWQAELWRRLRARVGTPAPAEVLETACARLRADRAASDLPSRLSVFGASRLSPARLMVLAALAEHRAVHLWLHHPSPALWAAVANADPAVLRRADDRTRHELRHPLLESMARDLLELQHLVRRCAPGAVDVEHPSPSPPATLLGRLKADLAADSVPSSPPPLKDGDRSVQVHACHGRMRQVEVLREVVLGLLEADTTLEPRDVLVMCPDVETFAPLIAAAFSLGSPDDAHHPASRLRVRLADRALRQTNPLLEVLSQLLALGTARMTAPQVLDLAGRPAVRQRFGFADDDLEQLRDWVVDAGVRWGLDTDHRQGWKLGNLDQGTWRAGLDRLLLGVAMHGDILGPGQTVPVDDVDSAGIDLAGRLAELVDRLSAAQLLMAGQHTAAEWMAGLQVAVESLATVRTRDSWQQLQLSGELADVAEAAAGSAALIGLADVRSLLGGVLAGRPTRASFRTGTLTVCTLVPMRSVPHRVVCVIGLDDGAFPRQSGRDGDDVLARDPWVGERDPRSEDRQLLLDAVFAAGDHLVIAYSGADERTGVTIPPAVPLGEILDALDRTATVTGGGPVRDTITTRHPLQPFDARNFMAGELDTPGPFSFDPVALGGASAATRARPEPPAFLSGPLPAEAPADIDLDSLQRLLEHPARGFLRQRLQVAPSWAEDEPDDAIPIDLDSLQAWDVGERALRERMAGLDASRCREIELRRGALPPGPLGDAELTGIGATVEAIMRAASTELAVPPESHDIDIDLLDGTRLVGTVGGVRGDVLLSVTYSRLSPKHRLHAWVPLVCLAVAFPHRPWRAVAVGKGSPAMRSELGPLSAGQARDALAELVELYRAGLRAPLPLPVKTTGEYVRRRALGGHVEDGLAAARTKWVTEKFSGEQADAAHALVYGVDAPIEVLTLERPWPDEGGAGWPPDEPDRFGLLARRLWARLLDVETLGQA